MKYINIQFHYIRDEINSSKINLIYIILIDIAADGLIKPLAGPQFYTFFKYF